MAADSKVSIDIVGKDRASGAFKSASRALDNLSKKVSGIPIIGGKASQALSGIASSLTPQAVAAGAGAAIGALVTAGAAAVVKTQELAQQVLQFQRVTQLSAETSSRFVSALDDMGIASETGANALFKLNQNADRLRAMGVVVSGDVANQFGQVADAIASTEDPSRRAEIAMAAFGRGGKELLPILELGSKRFQELMAAADSGQVFSAAQLAESEAFRRSLDDLGDSANHVTYSVGKELIPEVTKMINGMVTLAEVGNSAADVLGEDVTRGILQVGRAALVVGTPVTRLLEMLRVLDRTEGDAGVGADDLAESLRDVTSGLEDGADAADDFQQALFASLRSTEALASAEDRQEDATASLADARANLNDLLRRGAVDTDAVARAQEDLARASEGVADAEDRLGDARDRLNRLLNPSAADAEELAVQRARAMKEIADAERRLNVVRAAGGSPTAIAEAELVLREARLELAKTDEDAAQKAEDVEDARKDVAEAERDLAKSKDEAKRAGDALRQAEAGDPNFSRDLAKAREAVERGERGVASAKLGVVEATMKQREASLLAAEAFASEAGALKGLLEQIAKVDPALAVAIGLSSAAQKQAGTAPAPQPSRGMLGDIAHRVSEGVTNITTNVYAPMVSPETVDQITDAQTRQVRLQRLVGP